MCIVDVFNLDSNFLENEKWYEDLKRSILRDESSSEDEEYSDDVSSEEKNEEQMRRKEFERVFEEVNTWF